MLIGGTNETRMFATEPTVVELQVGQSK
jgi:hypothetical protein